jgi:hypothetical protein
MELDSLHSIGTKTEREVMELVELERVEAGFFHPERIHRAIG